MKPSDYKGIYLWGKKLSSYDSYIEHQQELAALANAPVDAIYARSDDGIEWQTVSGLREGHEFKLEYAEFIKPKDTWQGVYPGMCINPEICRGKSHCPRSISCCE